MFRRNFLYASVSKVRIHFLWSELSTLNWRHDGYFPLRRHLWLHDWPLFLQNSPFFANIIGQYLNLCSDLQKKPFSQIKRSHKIGADQCANKSNLGRRRGNRNLKQSAFPQTKLGHSRFPWELLVTSIGKSFWTEFAVKTLSILCVQAHQVWHFGLNLIARGYLTRS